MNLFSHCGFSLFLSDERFTARNQRGIRCAFGRHLLPKRFQLGGRSAPRTIFYFVD
jgi:hypothetical protein